MTITLNNSSPVEYAGNSSAVSFSYPWKISAATDLLVGFIVAGVYTLQSSTTYAVTGVGNNGGGSVVFATAPPLGTTVNLRPQTPETQPTEFANLAAYLPENSTNAADRIVRMIQDLTRLTYTFGIHGPDQESMPWPALPNAASRAGFLLGFDTVTGLPSLSVPLSTFLNQTQFNTLLNTPATPGNAIANAMLAAASQSAVGPLLYPTLPGETGVTNNVYPYGNVLRFGADPTGVTDSTTAFQNCHNSGSFLYIPPGQFLLNQATTTTAFQITKSDFTMVGAGPASQLIHTEMSTIPLSPSPNVAVIEVRPLNGNIQDLYFADFRITGPFVNTGATPNNASSIKCQGIIFNTGTAADIGNITGVLMRNVVIEKMGFSCFTVNGSSNSGTTQYCAGFLFQGCRARYGRQDGFNDDAGCNFDILFVDCLAHDLDGIGHEHAGAGDMVIGGSVERCAGGVALDFNATFAAALLAGTAPYTAPGNARKLIQGVTISHCYTAGSPSTPGIEVSEAQPAIYTTIRGCTIAQCGGHGIIFSQLGSYCEVIGNTIRDVGAAAANTYNAISYGNVQTDSVCTGNVCDTTLAGYSMQYGISFGVGGPGVNFSAYDNSVNNAATANYSLPTPASGQWPACNFRRGLPSISKYVPQGNTGSSATVLQSAMLANNMLEAVNQTVKIKAWGYCAANANAKTAALLWDATTLISVTGAQNGGAWMLEATLAVTVAGSAGALNYGGRADQFAGAAVAPTEGQITAVNLSGATHTIEVKGTGVASTDIVQTGLLIEFPDTY